VKLDDELPTFARSLSARLQQAVWGAMPSASLRSWRAGRHPEGSAANRSAYRELRKRAASPGSLRTRGMFATTDGHESRVVTGGATVIRVRSASHSPVTIRRQWRARIRWKASNVSSSSFGSFHCEDCRRRIGIICCWRFHLGA